MRNAAWCGHDPRRCLESVHGGLLEAGAAAAPKLRRSTRALIGGSRDWKHDWSCRHAGTGRDVQADPTNSSNC